MEQYLSNQPDSYYKWNADATDPLASRPQIETDFYFYLPMASESS